MLPVYPQVHINHTFLRSLILGDSGRAYTPIPSLLSPSTVTHAFSLSSSPLCLPLHFHPYFLSPLPFQCHSLHCNQYLFSLSSPLPLSPMPSLLSSPSILTHTFSPLPIHYYPCLPSLLSPPLSPMPSFSSSPSLSPPSNHLLPTALHCQPSYQ